DQLAKRLLVASSGPGQQVRSHFARFPLVLRKLPIGTDPARDANWAVPGRPVFGPAGIYLSSERQQVPVSVGRIERNSGMRNVIEYTLVSADGAFDDPVNLGFMQYQDDAYMRD